MLRPFIKDANLTVRMEVAQLLAGIPASELRPQDIADLEPLFEEYLAVQSDHLDMPSVQLQIANFWIDRGDSIKATAALEEALRLNPQLEPAIVNLVDILRREGKNDEASALLSSAILSASPTQGACGSHKVFISSALVKLMKRLCH